MTGSDPPLCARHADRGTPCTATSRAGSPCRAWAVAGTDPPVCPSHGGDPDYEPGPPGNQHGLKHGFYASPRLHLPYALYSGMSLDDVIEELFRRHAHFNAYMDEVLTSGTGSISELINLFQLHGWSAWRIVRLLRLRRERAPTRDELLTAAIHQALDELGEELGIDL